jgi:hypothetical protein
VKDGLQHMQEGKVNPNQPSVGVLNGVDLIETPQVSAQKITYRIADTPEL